LTARLSRALHYVEAASSPSSVVEAFDDGRGADYYPGTRLAEVEQAIELRERWKTRQGPSEDENQRYHAQPTLYFAVYDAGGTRRGALLHDRDEAQRKASQLGGEVRAFSPLFGGPKD
jgi:hypothetical protein